MGDVKKKCQSMSNLDIVTGLISISNIGSFINSVGKKKHVLFKRKASFKRKLVCCAFNFKGKNLQDFLNKIFSGTHWFK